MNVTLLAHRNAVTSQQVLSPRSVRRDACQSKNPSCRRGTITTQGRAHILSSPTGGVRGGQGIGDLP